MHPSYQTTTWHSVRWMAQWVAAPLAGICGLSLAAFHYWHSYWILQLAIVLIQLACFGMMSKAGREFA